MVTLVQNNLREIEQLCRLYQVERLEVFGSAAGSQFKPESSDVDFIVTFLPGVDLGPWLTIYFDSP